jgi:mono/diheme cytochrome c family protein
MEDLPMRILSLLLVVLSLLGKPAAAEDEKLTFEQHIRPIFRVHCFDCHGANDELKGKLDLRLVRLIQKGGETGPAIVPGKAEGSYLLERVRRGEMPPGEKKLSAGEIATIERWITAGANTARPEPESIGPGLGITAEERSFWSFQPIRRPDVRDGSSWPGEARVRTPIDALILQAAPDGSRFSPDADRRTLVKRAYFDLIGLPPSTEEMQRWLAETSGDWFDRLLTELLDSPHYGERWARHWLDVAGYADSDGYTAADAERPWMWKYRDWVIRSLNADKPFDRFITEQLAGDELAGPQNGDLAPEQIELLTATGFLRLAADGTGTGADNPDGRNQVMADTLKIVGTSLLGLSIQCAQCHDHRYDPIPQTDYFALRAVFEPALDWQAWKVPDARRISLYTAADRQRAAEIEADAQKIAGERGQKESEYMQQALDKELMKFDEPLRTQLREAYQTPGDKRSEEQKQLLAKNPSVNISPGVLYQYLPAAAEDLKKFDQRISETRAKKPVEEFLHALVEPPNHAPETKLFFRGNHQQPKQTVTPAALTVAVPEDKRLEFPLDDPALPTTGRRLAFANWLTGSDNPLFARVIVNRVWMHHFGKGLVATPADFGKLGVAPSHPQLLDWLADEFMRQGWSLKQLHRLIMNSTAWRQSKESTGTPHSAFRTPLVRLEAETMRDRMLAATGQLDRKLFGAPVGVKEDDAGQVIVDGSQTRRSLYIQARRSRPVAMLQAFDAPVMETNCESRSSSTVATQSLMLINGEFILDQAAKLADRAATDAKPLSNEQLAALPMIPTVREFDWQYGYGQFDEAANRTGPFTTLAHWTGSQWQGGPQLPDAQLGWVLLHASGGHPDLPERAAIRRWTAPDDGTISISGSLSHGSANGNGVRGRIISSRSGKAGEWTAHNGSADTPVANLEVKAGDMIDFITDSMGDYTSDSFGWPVTIVQKVAGQPEQKIVSADQFRGPTESSVAIAGQIVRAWELALCRPPSADELVLAMEFVKRQVATFSTTPAAIPAGRTGTRQAVTNLCQSLLSSNEFLYVD